MVSMRVLFLSDIYPRIVIWYGNFPAAQLRHLLTSCSAIHSSTICV
jgi:hypothetical protein